MKPGDVLTDVVLRLTFDNHAYVDETSDAVAGSARLPDSPAHPGRNSPPPEKESFMHL